MDFDAVCNGRAESRLQREDEERLAELRYLLNKIYKEDQDIVGLDMEAMAALVVFGSRRFPECDVAPGLDVLEHQIGLLDIVALHQIWLKALSTLMPYLRKRLLALHASMVIKLKCTLKRYAEIYSANLLVVIQPKIQTLNSIEA